MSDEQDADKIREVMALLGKRTSDRKKATSAANAAKATEALRGKERPHKPCDCGRTDGTHRWNCPWYRRAASAKQRAKKG